MCKLEVIQVWDQHKFIIFINISLLYICRFLGSTIISWKAIRVVFVNIVGLMQPTIQTYLALNICCYCCPRIFPQNDGHVIHSLSPRNAFDGDATAESAAWCNVLAVDLCVKTRKWLCYIIESFCQARRKEYDMTQCVWTRLDLIDIFKDNW